jgi:Protein of unknown function (DUF2997)
MRDCSAGADHRFPSRLVTISSTRSATVPQQVLRYRIRPDGRVEELVEGMVGPDCTALTAAIEDRLGPVVSTVPTTDHYAVQPAAALSDVALQHGPH